MYKKGASLFVILIFFITFSLYTSPNVSAESHISEVPEGYVGIYTAEDLNKMRENLNSKYILMNDIDLSHATSEGGDFYHNGAGWEPIGTKEKPFEGTFDGNGYNIIGMKINIKTDQTIYAGLFGYGEDLTVQNLGMVNSSITVENTSIYSDSSDVYAGAIVGYIDTSYPTRGSIDHSYNTGNIKANSMFDSYAGGLVGFAEMTNITESYNTGDISANEAGGIIGKLQSSESTIISSYNEGKITAEEYAGGIVATTFGKQIKDSKNKGDIISNNIAAGIAGYTASNISIINAVNEGKITGDYRAVGLVGSLGYNSTIQGSQNRGDVTATDYASGIAGGLSSSIIVDSYNTGHIISKEFYAAGITFSSNNKSTILRTYNAGTVEAYYTGAGITTTNYQNSTIRDTFNIGDVKSRNHVSGIAGNNYGLIENTYNLGNIDSSYSFSYEAAIVGKNESGTVTNNYYLNTASNGVLPTNGLDTDEGARSITYEQLQDASTFQGFDFDSTWTMNGNEDFKFPELKDNQVDATEEILDVVTKSNPNKETYVEGEPLDITGAVITARTNFGNTSDVEVTPDMVVSNYNPNQIGGQNVKVAYQDNFAYFYVRVNEKDRIPPKEVTDIQVSSTTNTVEITFTNPTDTDFVTAKLYVYGEYVGEVKDGHYLLEEL
ncbi:MAG TPA: GLUG motif-containing protein, partial [Ureibacillus sp.]|nr:GLUG motif-containing protein [Ureibacillus sp.]